MDIPRKGLLLVLSSPSGAGKTTISRSILSKDKDLYMSVSATTRQKRESENDGVDYYFLENNEFDSMIEKGDFLEHAVVFENKYGTPKEPVYEILERGKDVLFDIDWQGTLQLKEKCSDDVVSIFILPPSMKELEKRLRSRGQDDDDVIAHRMSKAENEISKWDVYDYVLVNENIEETTKRVNHILESERNKRERLSGLKNFVSGLID